jgi:hydrogenase maturation protease
MLKVIGIGNTLRGDDGIGPVVIEELKKRDLPESIQLIDVGSDAFSIIDHFENNQPVLVIDCAQMDKEPGDILKFDVNDENLPILDKAISIHGFGFSEVYKMAQGIYEDIQCSVIGVQPMSIEFNTGLSEEIKNKIPLIINMVLEENKKHV